jgi:hypothetical protein
MEKTDIKCLPIRCVESTQCHPLNSPTKAVEPGYKQNSQQIRIMDILKGNRPGLFKCIYVIGGGGKSRELL